MVNLLWKATRAGVPTVMDVQTSSVADMMTIFRSDRVLNKGFKTRSLQTLGSNRTIFRQNGDK